VKSLFFYLIACQLLPGDAGAIRKAWGADPARAMSPNRQRHSRSARRTGLTSGGRPFRPYATGASARPGRKVPNGPVSPLFSPEFGKPALRQVAYEALSITYAAYLFDQKVWFGKVDFVIVQT
jgi:hypothetical protein